MYESLTSYIPRLSTSCHGEWIVDCENDGTPEHPIQMPFVDYDDIAVRFMEDVYRFIDAHLDMFLTNYGDILENNGLKWSAESMTAADVSELDGQAIMALVVGAIRADRFCEGTLLELLENGSVLRWLRRLKEIDEHEISKMNFRDLRGVKHENPLAFIRREPQIPFNGSQGEDWEV